MQKTYPLTFEIVSEPAEDGSNAVIFALFFMTYARCRREWAVRDGRHRGCRFGKGASLAFSHDFLNIIVFFSLQILTQNSDVIDRTVPVYDPEVSPSGEASHIGSLQLTVECLAALNAVFKKKSLADSAETGDH